MLEMSLGKVCIGTQLAIPACWDHTEAHSFSDFWSGSELTEDEEDTTSHHIESTTHTPISKVAMPSEGGGSLAVKKRCAVDISSEFSDAAAQKLIDKAGVIEGEDEDSAMNIVRKHRHRNKNRGKGSKEAHLEAARRRGKRRKRQSDHRLFSTEIFGSAQVTATDVLPAELEHEGPAWRGRSSRMYVHP